MTTPEGEDWIRRHNTTMMARAAMSAIARSGTWTDTPIVLFRPTRYDNGRSRHATRTEIIAYLRTVGAVIQQLPRGRMGRRNKTVFFANGTAEVEAHARGEINPGGTLVGIDTTPTPPLG